MIGFGEAYKFWILIGSIFSSQILFLVLMSSCYQWACSTALSVVVRGYQMTDFAMIWKNMCSIRTRWMSFRARDSCIYAGSSPWRPLTSQIKMDIMLEQEMNVFYNIIIGRDGCIYAGLSPSFLYSIYYCLETSDQDEPWIILTVMVECHVVMVFMQQLFYAWYKWWHMWFLY